MAAKKVFTSINQSINKKEIDYLMLCNSLTPAERIKKGFELSEWSIMLCKNITEELEKRSFNAFILK